MEVADLQNFGGAACGHHRDAFTLVQFAINDTHIGDHSFVGVVVRVKDQGAQRCL